jgi:hypothetical protein
VKAAGLCWCPDALQRPTGCMHHAGSPPGWCILRAVEQQQPGQQTAAGHSQRGRMTTGLARGAPLTVICVDHMQSRATGLQLPQKICLLSDESELLRRRTGAALPAARRREKTSPYAQSMLQTARKEVASAVGAERRNAAPSPLCSLRAAAVCVRVCAQGEARRQEWRR